MRIDDLIVEPGREEHIDRHRVTVAEVNEVVFGSPVWRRTREGRYLLLGQTTGGRYLAIVVAPRKPGVFGLVTARDATEADRRFVRAQRRR